MIFIILHCDFYVKKEQVTAITLHSTPENLEFLILRNCLSLTLVFIETLFTKYLHLLGNKALWGITSYIDYRSKNTIILRTSTLH